MGVGAGATALIGTAASVIGTGVSVYGAIQQGQAQKQAADYQAQVAKNNAIVASQNAAAVQGQAAAKAQQDQRAGDIRLSAQRAALGANGGTLDSGSALNVQETTAGTTQQGVNNDLFQGQLAGYGYNVQGSNYQAQSGLDAMTGANAQSASYTSAASSFLGGASQVAPKWNSYLQASAPSGGVASSGFDTPGAP